MVHLRRGRDQATARTPPGRPVSTGSHACAQVSQVVLSEPRQVVLWGDRGRERVHLRGSLRQATATAAVSGLPAELAMNGPVQGRLLTASMSTSRERHQTS